MSYFSSSFTDWDRQTHLLHYGVKGMKWGVRKYLNKQGEMTKAGVRRYSENATKKTRAGKIQRDFNRLDQSFANVHANRVDVQRAAIGHIRKAAKKQLKLMKKGVSKENAEAAVRKKYEPKILKDEKEYQKYDRQTKGIEALQGRVIGTAAKNKYTVTSKPVKRLGMSNKDRFHAFASASSLGSLGTVASVYATSRDKAKLVDGQHIKVKKHGDGSVKLVNYYNMNHPKRSRHKTNFL